MSTKNGNFLVLLDFLMRWEKTVFSEVSGIAVINIVLGIVQFLIS